MSLSVTITEREAKLFIRLLLLRFDSENGSGILNGDADRSLLASADAFISLSEFVLRFSSNEYSDATGASIAASSTSNLALSALFVSSPI